MNYFSPFQNAISGSISPNKMLDDYVNNGGGLPKQEIGQKYGEEVKHRYDWLGRAKKPIGGSDKPLLDLITKHKDIDNPALFMASFLEEGGDKFQNNSLEDQEYYRKASKEGKFPISGAGAFGLDTIGERVDEFIKKGLLPKDFKDRIEIVPFMQAGESSGKTYKSANFKDIEDVILAKKAFFQAESQDLDNWIKNENLEVSDNVKQLLKVAAYNAGQKGIRDAVKSWEKQGLLKDDRILIKKPDSYKQVWEQGMRRIQSANMLINEDGIEGKEVKFVKPMQEYIDSPKRDINTALVVNPIKNQRMLNMSSPIERLNAIAGGTQNVSGPSFKNLFR